MLEKKYAGGNVPLDGGMASAWLQGGEGGLDREKDDPVCRLFTFCKKPAIKVDKNGGKGCSTEPSVHFFNIFEQSCKFVKAYN